ncbi:MAG: hypothetical protein HN423_03940 [Alphaproteobacteria bacterium]|nr:hypothetical protein [Alphaproteobacteria bacterium]
MSASYGAARWPSIGVALAGPVLRPILFDTSLSGMGPWELWMIARDLADVTREVETWGPVFWSAIWVLVFLGVAIRRLEREDL